MQCEKNYGHWLHALAVARTPKDPSKEKCPDVIPYVTLNGVDNEIKKKGRAMFRENPLRFVCLYPEWPVQKGPYFVEGCKEFVGQEEEFKKELNEKDVKLSVPELETP